MPSPVKPRPPTKKQQAAMDAAYEARKQLLAARTARDAATPLWLKALRQYIDAAIEHCLAMQEVGGDGHYSSDMAGQEQCENLWTNVVNALVLADIAQEAQEIGRRDEERRERLALTEEKPHG